MLIKRKHSTIFYIVFVLIKIMRAAVIEAEKIHLLCQYDGSIEGCSFIIPGEDVELKLTPNQTQSLAKYTYFGKGFKEGECGVSIQNLSIENQGYATCILMINNTFELYEAIEVKTIDRNDIEMILPKIKILNSAPLKVGQTLLAECSTKSYTDAKFLWFFNDRVLNDTDFDMAMKKFDRDMSNIFESKSILKYDLLNITENESALKCRVYINNKSVDYIDSEITLLIYDESNEPKIGLPYEISIKFFAYPRVLSSRWRVNERNIYYGKATNEFSSKELKYLGKNEWNAFLYISNITEENIHYNYTLQISDSEGTKFYNVRLDNLTHSAFTLERNKNSSISTKPKMAAKNFVTQLPEYRKKSKTNSYRGTQIRNFTNPNDTALGTERKIKFVRKQQYQLNTTAEMTSVIVSTTTQATSSFASIISTFDDDDDNARDINKTLKGNNFTKYIENENYYNNTILTNYYENNETKKNNNFESTTFKMKDMTTSKNAGVRDWNYNIYQLKEYVFASIFFTLIFVIIIITILLCHYRHQVTVLKNEIIQMNLESYYNHSCLSFNEYSSSRINSNGVLYDNKRHLSGSSGESIVNTNSHLYQSIDEIDTHVYDEIINSIESNSGGDEKPNNYENNESFNSIHEILIRQHCHSLIATIEEVDEYESSQLQKLSNLETTYI